MYHDARKPVFGGGGGGGSNNTGADQPVHRRSLTSICYSLIGKYHT